jgi:hypothetical protein
MPQLLLDERESTSTLPVAQFVTLFEAFESLEQRPSTPSGSRPPAPTPMSAAGRASPLQRRQQAASPLRPSPQRRPPRLLRQDAGARRRRVLLAR